MRFGSECSGLLSLWHGGRRGRTCNGGRLAVTFDCADADDGGAAGAEASACAGVRGCADSMCICKRRCPEPEPPDISVKVEV